ncbi:marine proteobacterial sortase target protein [Thalassotalea piscium]
MFNSYKKIQFTDYQDSYFYQQKRKKQRRKWLNITLVLTFILVLGVFIVPKAQSKNIDHQLTNETSISTEHSLIQGPQLLFNHPDHANRIAFPLDIKANIEINGLMAYAEITQVFINPYEIELEGKYQFPLPESAAIKHLKVKVGNKEIIGQIMEKHTAKAVYNRAKRQGKKASLVQQQRANLFTNNIANIPAKSTVVVTLSFIMPVSFFNDKLNINLPLAMTPRYRPFLYQNSPAEVTMSTATSKRNMSELASFSLSNDSFNHLSLNLNHPTDKVIAKSQASINIKLDGGVPISSITSASHEINTQALDSEQSKYLITLTKVQTQTNRNFNLTWQLESSQQPQVSSFTEQIDDDYYTLLTFFPPSAEQTTVFARDIIFIIDTSGSMQGGSMAQAKYGLEHAISLLNNQDSFNIIAFDDATNVLFHNTQMVTETSINKAHDFINNLQADGGTEMYRPLSQALVMARNSAQTTKAIRQVVFITDGAVANEFELMTLLNSAQSNFRLFTVGIGAAPNGYFMKKAAQFGRGSYVFIQNTNDVQKSISALMTKISQPAISNIQLMFDNQVQQQVDVYPKKLTDLYLGEPMQVAVKSKLPITSVQLTGDTATQPWYKQLVLDESQPSKGISTVWARHKIEDLLDGLVMGADKSQVKQQVISTSISHQIISPYTSFIAVEKQPDLSTLTAAQKTKTTQLDSAALAKNQENLSVAMPKTALGWKQQFLFGLLLLLLAPLTFCFRSK